MYKILNTGKKSKRTGKNTVALLGLAPTSRELCPFDDEDTEIWCLNESYVMEFITRWDRWFQMHSRSNFMRPDNPNDPNHPQWLRQPRNFPLYMQRRHKDIPGSVAFPFEEVMATMGGRRYFTSTFGYMIGLAVLEGFERIELYGFEMASNTEYFYQRANAEYLMGVATGKGVDVWVPAGCNVLSGTLYGYSQMNIGFRQGLEITAKEAEDTRKKLEQAYFKHAGAVEHLESQLESGVYLMDAAAVQEELKNLRLARNKYQAEFNQFSGKVMAYQAITKAFDAFPFETDREEI